MGKSIITKYKLQQKGNFNEVYVNLHFFIKEESVKKDYYTITSDRYTSSCYIRFAQCSVSRRANVVNCCFLNIQLGLAPLLCKL